jgi:hypothetical protein
VVPRAHRLATLIALLLLAACGGSGNSPTAKSTPTPTPTPTPAPSPTLDIGALAAAAAGTYSGNWKNTTFGSTGTVTAVMTVDRTALTVTTQITITGNVFGGAPPAPETFSGKIGDFGALGFSGHSPTFGDFTITSTGPTFVMKAQNVPTDRIDHFEADGNFAPGAISGTYKVYFKDGTTADGNFSLTKQ